MSHTEFRFYICSYAESNAHMASLFVLLGYVPDKDRIQNYKSNLNFTSWLKQYRTRGKHKLDILTFATIFTSTLNQMHTWLCCLCFWVILSVTTNLYALGVCVCIETDTLKLIDWKWQIEMIVWSWYIATDTLRLIVWTR